MLRRGNRDFFSEFSADFSSAALRLPRFTGSADSSFGLRPPRFLAGLSVASAEVFLGRRPPRLLTGFSVSSWAAGTGSAAAADSSTEAAGADSRLTAGAASVAAASSTVATPTASVFAGSTFFLLAIVSSSQKYCFWDSLAAIIYCNGARGKRKRDFFKENPLNVYSNIEGKRLKGIFWSGLGFFDGLDSLALNIQLCLGKSTLPRYFSLTT